MLVVLCLAFSMHAINVAHADENADVSITRITQTRKE
jgi:hypothetical protein